MTTSNPSVRHFAIVAAVVLSLLAATAPANAHTEQWAHRAADQLLMTDLTGQIKNTQSGCTSHVVVESSGVVNVDYDGYDGPFYRTTATEDYENDPDKRWKTEVQFKLDEGTDTWEVLITDYNTNDETHGSLAKVTESGCGLYGLAIDGWSQEQTWDGSKWVDFGDFRNIAAVSDVAAIQGY